jgi:RHS repeat-associated protein
VRYTTPNKTLPTPYTFTGQFSYVADEATDLGSAGFGLMFYNARWYDPYLGRFAQADTIIPGGVQGLDRYAYGLNNPSRYSDPSGHAAVSETEAGCSGGGPACIMDMWSGYDDEDHMMAALRNWVRHHKDYDPVSDTKLSDEEKAIVSIAMFHVAVQDTPDDASLWDIIKATWPSAASLSIFGIINEGINMSPDDNGGGGGWSTGRGPKNAAERAAIDKILADPWHGRQIISDLGDPRWPPEEGWVKMETKIGGQKYHWNLNKITGEVEDIKPVP